MSVCQSLGKYSYEYFLAIQDVRTEKPRTAKVTVKEK